MNKIKSKETDLAKIASDLSQQCSKQLWNTLAYHSNKFLPLSEADKIALSGTTIALICGEFFNLIVNSNPNTEKYLIKQALLSNISRVVDQFEEDL